MSARPRSARALCSRSCAGNGRALPRPAKWLLGLGLFFGVSSLLMRRVYPMGTTVMCILVPVLMLLAVVFLLYQHEFAVHTIA